MENKFCNLCKQEKPISDFNKKKDKTQSNCRDCTKANTRKHYKENKSYYYDKNINKKQELRDLINKIKSVPCKDCNNIFHHSAMDFDHIDNKEYNVSHLVNRGSVNKILKEIKKCEIVCSNCHRIRTYNRLHKVY